MKPFSKRIIVFCYIFSSLSLFAQEKEKSLVFIPNIGINFSYIGKPIANFPVSEEVNIKSKIGIAYTIGANLRIPVSKGIEFITGIQHVNYKYSFEDFSINDRLNKYIYSTSLSIHSIEAPIIFSKNIFTYNFKINAGVQLGYIISAHSEDNIKHYKKDNNDFWAFKDKEKERINIKGLIKREKISIPVGFSYELSHLYFSLLYNFEITKIYKDNHSQNIMFKVGYKI